MNTRRAPFRVILAASALMLAACSSGDDVISLDPAAVSASAARVEVVPVVTEIVDATIVATGSIEPIQAVDLGPPFMARVKAVHVTEGDRVEEGKVLVELDTASMNAQIAAARSQVTNARVQLDQAQAELERTRNLAERGVATQQQLEQVTAQVEVLRASVSAGNSNVRAIQTTASDGRVKAPFTGTIVRVGAELGQQAAPGMSLARLVDMSSVDVRVTLTESQIAAARVGQDVVVKVPSLGIETTGKVRFISPELTPQTRSGEALIRVDNADGRLLAGVFAEIKIDRVEPIQAMVIPPTAVLRSAGATSVFVLEDGVAKAREVRVEALNDGRWKVVSGLRDGEQVVVGELGRVRDGQPLPNSAPTTAGN